MDFPEGWEDRSIQLLSHPEGSKEPIASLSVTRHRLDGNGGLTAYIDMQLSEMARSCPRFSLVLREPVTVDGEPAERLAFTRCSQNGEILFRSKRSPFFPPVFSWYLEPQPQERSSRHMQKRSDPL